MKVRLEAIRKSYGKTIALQNIGLEIEEGEFFFLLGPSGCGKTTLLRLLAGFEEADSGRILFDGREMKGVPPEKRNSGMVFQNYALWPHMTVGENVAFGLEVRGVSSKECLSRVQEALDLVHLGEYIGRRPVQLSGGQQQRVALARALVIRPELVLLDEPLSNLDARLRLEMRSEIRSLIKDLGHTAVYVTHDQKEALAMADRCAILRDGNIEQIGTPKELYCQPANRFTAEFLGETNFLAAQVLEKESGSGLYLLKLKDLDLTWRGASNQPLTGSQQVLVSIRPEAIRISEGPIEGMNLLPAVRSKSVYLGEVTQHTFVAVENGQVSLQLLELHSSDLPEGPVHLCAAPADTVILS